MSEVYDTFGRLFWHNLDDLQAENKIMFPTMTTPEISREEIISRIEDVIVQIVHQISTGSAPQLNIRSRRSWNNCVYVPNLGLKLIDDATYTTVSLANETSVEKFGLVLKVMSMVYKLLKSGKTATKRDLFYEETQLFRSQIILDQIVDDIACMLEVPRRMLNVVATSKGCMVGDLTFTEADGNVISCRQAASSIMVPLQVDKIQHLHSNEARFVLVVEKDATFQRLLDDGFVSSMPCIMITGKGVPDINTRLMIRKMWDALNIPVFGLVDADPHGIEIFFVYKFGSLSQSFDSSSLVLPFMRWIGIFPSDISRLGLPEDVILPLTLNDKSKCRDLVSRPYIQHFPRIEQELLEISQSQCKAEIQALTRISPKYLGQVFLPNKIKHGEWI